MTWKQLAACAAAGGVALLFGIASHDGGAVVAAGLAICALSGALAFGRWARRQ